jgi:hypothetical protein
MTMMLDPVVGQRVMSEQGLLLLEDLPHYFRDDPQVRGYVDAVSRELERVEALIDTVCDQWFSDIGMSGVMVNEYLSIWEFNLGLPIAPQGMTTDQRGSIVTSHIRKRTAETGADWVSVMNAGFGTGTWGYDEDYADYTVRLTIPYGSGTITATAVLALARQITPAHIDIVVTYSGGGGGGSFIIGISPIGVGQI